MNKKIIIFTVLLTNITFAYALPVQVRVVREVPESRKNSENLASMSIDVLCERGLEKSAAHKKVLAALKHDQYTTQIMAQNIMKHFKQIQHRDIVAYISDAALFGKSIDLSSYEHLIAFVQKTNKLVLDQESLEKIQKLSLENQTLV